MRPDIGERVLGHAIPGVDGMYDRHSYRDEKADALLRLAALAETIMHPPEGSVVDLVLNRGGVQVGRQFTPSPLRLGAGGSHHSNIRPAHLGQTQKR